MSRFQIPAPRRADGTLLPALLAALLLAGLVAQMLFVRDEAASTETAAPSRGIAVAARSAPVIAARPTPRSVLANPMFAPRRAVVNAPPQDALVGAQVVGSWSVAGRANLVLRQADGRSRTMRVGDAVNNWTLVAITPSAARFVQNGHKLVVPVGASVPATAAPTTASKEDNPE